MYDENKVHLIAHPLVQHKISLLRDKNTGTKEFRELVSETAMLISYEATRDLPMKEITVETPIGLAKTKVISGRKLASVPIMRAGLGMEDGIESLVPAAKVGHIGIFRDDANGCAPVQYYNKLPFDIAEREVIICDPMLATGHASAKAVQLIKDAGCTSIKFMCLIAAKPGIETLLNAHPDIELFCGAIDEKLNETNYICPGMGDAGDRIFGTK